MKKAMMRELQVRAGINFGEPLSIVTLHQALSMLYGTFTAELITESMIVRLDEIAENRDN